MRETNDWLPKMIWNQWMEKTHHGNTGVLFVAVAVRGSPREIHRDTGGHLLQGFNRPMGETAIFGLTMYSPQIETIRDIGKSQLPHTLRILHVNILSFP